MHRAVKPHADRLRSRSSQFAAESAAARDANAAAAVEAARRASLEAAEGAALRVLRAEFQDLRAERDQLQQLRAW